MPRSECVIKSPCLPSGRLFFVKFLFEFAISVLLNSQAGLTYQAQIIMQVMKRAEAGRQNLFGDGQMAQIGAGIVFAGVASAIFIEGPWVFFVRLVAQVKRPGCSEDGAVPGIARRQNAVEHVDAAVDAFNEV